MKTISLLAIVLFMDVHPVNAQSTGGEYDSVLAKKLNADCLWNEKILPRNT